MLPEWCHRRPATTIVGTKLISGPGTSVFIKGGVSRQDRPGAYVASAPERAVLQTYPAHFIWSRREAEQIGNAVPPLLALKILEAFYE